MRREARRPPCRRGWRRSTSPRRGSAATRSSGTVRSCHAMLPHPLLLPSIRPRRREQCGTAARGPSPATLSVQENFVIVADRPWATPRRRRDRVADIIELEQLLARYAVGMTKDDVDAVMAVFTPDGTYSAFGDTYALADFPTLVAAAPKGLFMVGPAGHRARRRHRHRRAAAVLRRPDQPRHAHRLVHRHLPPHRRRLAAAHPVDDLPPQERRPRLRPGPRPHPPRARPPAERARWSSTSSGPRSTRWLDEHHDDARRPTTAGGSLDDADGPAVQGEAPRLRRRLDALGLARARRRPRRVDPAARPTSARR